MIKRIINYNKQDWQHISFLFCNGIKQFFKGDLHESREAFIWLKIHLMHDSKLVKCERCEGELITVGRELFCKRCSLYQ